MFRWFLCVALVLALYPMEAGAVYSKAADVAKECQARRANGAGAGTRGAGVNGAGAGARGAGVTRGAGAGSAGAGARGAGTQPANRGGPANRAGAR
jgi:hypothetical protein